MRTIVTRITGMYSGFDTDNMVKLAVSKLTNQRDKVLKKQQKIEWTQDKWKTINSKVYSFYADTLTSSRTEGYYETKDNDELIEKIKKVVDGYNSVLKDMNTEYNQKQLRKYEPLTEEEKESMTESQINKWESSIKDSLLGGDSNLRDIISTFKSISTDSFEVDGKKYTLASLGIEAGSYLTTDKIDRGILKVDEKKLRAAVESNPDVVKGVMRQASADLYNKIDSKMSSTSYRSKYKVYDDKKMTEQFNLYTQKLTQYEKKIAKQEDRYYKQYAAMEKALAAVNSQQNYFSSFFGIN